MPRYRVELHHVSMEIEADNEEDAAEEFLAGLTMHDQLAVIELDPPLCAACSGSGEGRHDGMKCDECNGTGIEPEGEG